MLGIVVLAAALRFAGIGSRLTIDDAYSWFAASSPNAHVFLQRLADNENTPPLIYLVLMLMPGSQPVWLRVPAAIPGVLICLVVFMALRPRLGDRASLLAALAVAVAPYLVTYSNLARGFMLADLALLIVLWCLLSLAERETTGRWVALVLAGTVAVYSEYRSAIVLIAMVLAALWLGAPKRRATLVAGALVLLTLVAWIPEIVRAQDQVGVTKFDPLAATPSLTGLRDVFVTLALGEHGGTVVGIDIFTQRYLTILVPFGAGLGAAAITTIRSRWLVPVAVLLLIALGLGNFARRLGGEWQPDLTPVRVAAQSLRPRMVLTNTPAVLDYLGAFRPVFDRPYNLGPGRAQRCSRPCLIIDDTRVPGGTPRRAIGAESIIGPYLLVYER